MRWVMKNREETISAEEMVRIARVREKTNPVLGRMFAHRVFLQLSNQTSPRSFTSASGEADVALLVGVAGWDRLVLEGSGA
jgi:hypothetical protein